MKIAALQMVSGQDVAANLAKCLDGGQPDLKLGIVHEVGHGFNAPLVG